MSKARSFDVTHEDILKFFADKDPSLCPIPKDFWQKRLGYIPTKRVFTELNGMDRDELDHTGFKPDIVELYKWICKNFHDNKNNRFDFLTLKYLPEDFDSILLYGEKNFDQKWHFFIAYYARREFYSRPECPLEKKQFMFTPLKAESDPRIDLRKLKNIELVMWLCAAAGVNSPTMAKYTANPASNPETIDREDMKILAEEITEGVRKAL